MKHIILVKSRVKEHTRRTKHGLSRVKSYIDSRTKNVLAEAIDYATEKHKGQKRKGSNRAYINHPIEVVHMINKIGKVHNKTVLSAAILHDIVEDTPTTIKDIENKFGPNVARLVQEVSDDKTLNYKTRKENQILHAPSLSKEAKIIKIADKICNIQEMPTVEWDKKRQIDYLTWAKQVVDKCRGVNKRLEVEFNKAYNEIFKLTNKLK